MQPFPAIHDRGARRRLTALDWGGRQAVSGMGTAFQLDADTAGFLLAQRPTPCPAIDFTAGTDLVLVREPRDFEAVPGVPLVRAEERVHPSSKATVRMATWPLMGGFVPRGARLPDGSPHPAAGTGFGIARRFSVDLSLGLEALWGAKDRLVDYLLCQFAWDGSELRTVSRDTVAPTDLLAGYRQSDWGLSGALPDGADLLQPVSGNLGDGPEQPGLLRWRFDDGRWRAASFQPFVTPDEVPHGIGARYFEPSCVREADGTLLATWRCLAWDPDLLPMAHDIPVRRSSDSGQTWEELFVARDLRADAPVTIGRTVAGRPYVTACLNMGRLAMDRETYAGRVPGTSREHLALWPLAHDHTGLEPHLPICDARARFGRPPSGSSWRVDHPVSSVLRLADGQWHALLTYRVLEDAAYFVEGLAAVPETGACLAEIDPDAPPQPIWRF